jgi:hypothetical protein
MSYETLTTTLPEIQVNYRDEMLRQEKQRMKLIYGYESPTTTLGDLALRFIIGHGIGAELAQAPVDALAITPDPTAYTRTLEALVDTTYAADAMPSKQRRA